MDGHLIHHLFPPLFVVVVVVVVVVVDQNKSIIKLIKLACFTKSKGLA